MWEARCKSGKLIIDDTTIKMMTGFLENNILWITSRASVTGVNMNRGTFMSTLVIRTTSGEYMARNLPTAKAQEAANMIGTTLGR